MRGPPRPRGNSTDDVRGTARFERPGRVVESSGRISRGSRFTAAPEIGGAPSRRKPTMKGLIMKMLLNALVIGLVGGFSLGAFRASADLEVSAAVQIHANADFDAPLAPHGAWIEVGSYVRCWRPAGGAVGWRPYRSGHWVRADWGGAGPRDEPWA